MKPTEGTILTVSRIACEKGRAAAEIDNDPVYVWSAICKGAAEAAGADARPPSRAEKGRRR